MKEQFYMHTVQKKIVFSLKIAGFLLVVSYAAAARLPVQRDISLLIWMGFVVFLVLTADYLLKCFITNPVSKICREAEKIAGLDFSSVCDIRSKDEFGDIAKYLNTMSENLQHAFEKLEKTNAMLENEVQKERRLLKERRELTDRLSHEMKTPLGIIRAYAEGLQDETGEDRKQKYSQIIISETERMSALITTLLDLSALESGAERLKSERFDFIELLETAAGRLLMDLPDADFKLCCKLPEQKLFVRSDKARMEQVLNNLIVNAKKNVSPGGIIRLSVTGQDGMLRFSISNQGACIPKEKLPKVFEKFYRDEHAGYSGSGLGLAIAAQVLSMQNFEYGVKNVSDGVMFFFSMPVIK